MLGNHARFVGLTLHELSHVYRYGHFLPLGLHANVVVTSSDQLLEWKAPEKSIMPA